MIKNKSQMLLTIKHGQYLCCLDWPFRLIVRNKC